MNDIFVKYSFDIKRNEVFFIFSDKAKNNSENDRINWFAKIFKNILDKIYSENVDTIYVGYGYIVAEIKYFEQLKNVIENNIINKVTEATKNQWKKQFIDKIII